MLVGVLAVIYRVQRTLARLKLMFFLSFLTWIQIVESPMYPSDSFGLRAGIGESNDVAILNDRRE